MKLILAVLISAGLFLGAAVPAMGGPSLHTPGTCVDAPNASQDGAIIAFINVTAHTNAPPVDLDLVNPCP